MSCPIRVVAAFLTADGDELARIDSEISATEMARILDAADTARRQAAAPARPVRIAGP